MKRMLLAMLFVAVLICAGAQAEGPTGGILPISTENAICLNPAFPNGDAPGDDTPGDDGLVINGPTECVTGTEYTWSLTGFGENLRLHICICDGSFPDPEKLDTLYLLEGNYTSITYTFYYPGEYGLYVFDDDSGNIHYYKIHVSDGGDNVVRRMIREIKAENPKAGEYERALWFHDWLLDHCEFDESYQYYDAASLFLRGTGVCNSYVRALALLLEEDGIDYRRITGHIDSTGHTWIAMKLDGVWCLCDPTWDDDCYSIDGERYLYFGMPEALFAIEHEDPYYIGGAVTCDSLVNCYYLRDESWQRFVPSTLSIHQSQCDSGYHCFLQTGWGSIGDVYFRNMIGEITAWGLSHTDWQDDKGRTFRPEFVYDWDAMVLIGRDPSGGTLKLPQSLRAIEAESFAGTAANHVIVPSGCVSIGACAFTGMDLWEIVIPDSVTDIDENAFAGCGSVVILANADSAAAAFAEEHDIPSLPDVFTGLRQGNRDRWAVHRDRR